MDAPPQKNTRRKGVVSYGSDEFEQAVARVPEALRSGEGMIFLFVGASKEEKQEGLTAVSAGDELNLHRFKVPNLLGDRLVETQGYLREAFDHADEDAAVLFFDEADVLFDGPDATGQPEGAEQKAGEQDAALSDYFFDRVEAYPGVAIVCFSSPRYVSRLEGHDADVVVEF